MFQVLIGILTIPSHPEETEIAVPVSSPYRYSNNDMIKAAREEKRTMFQVLIGILTIHINRKTTAAPRSVSSPYRYSNNQAK